MKSKLPPKINLIFRLDDYSALSNIQFERTLLQLLEKYNIPCTFGVVPFVYPDEWDPSPQIEHPLSDEKITLLKPYINKGLVEIALHGYHHHTQAKRLNGHIPGEFYGLSLQEQRQKIVHGKTFLEAAFSCSVTTFIPPWNTYDINTLNALEENKFTCFSTGPRFGPVQETTTLSYMPALCKLANTRDVIEQSRRSGHPWIIVWFHEYDFLEVSSERAVDRLTYDFLDSLFAWIVQQNDIVATTFTRAVLLNHDFTAHRYQIAGKLRQYRHITPPFLQKIQALPTYYPEINWLLGKYVRWSLEMFAYYFIIAGICLALVYYFGQYCPPIFSLGVGLSAGLICLVIGYLIMRSRKFYYRIVSFLAGMTGFMIGGLMRWIAG